jgi:hypothetical protein
LHSLGIVNPIKIVDKVKIAEENKINSELYSSGKSSFSELHSFLFRNCTHGEFGIVLIRKRWMLCYRAVWLIIKSILKVIKSLFLFKRKRDKKFALKKKK